MTTRGKYTHSLIYPLLVTLLLSCGGHPEQTRVLELSGITMGTVYDIKINSKEALRTRDKIQIGVAEILDHIDRSMSTYNPDSELSVINNNRTTDWLSVSDDLYTVLKDALHVSRITDGAFDVTVGPLVNLWGFGPEKKRNTIPSDADIRSRLADTGYRNLELRSSPKSVSKRLPGLYIDLSGIAKGYGVDKVAEFLERGGFSNYMVDIGGEIRARGINAKGSPWNIGIEKPIAGQRSVQRAIHLQDTAMATSGDYRNFFEFNGVRYSHTIDPKTGRPITHNLVSVTVLDPSTDIADALATGLLVLGPAAAAELAEKNHIAAYFIIRKNDGFEEHETPAFTAYINHGTLIDK